MVLGSLGTLNRSSGVRTLNVQMNGRPVALAMIEDAQFGEDNEGNTTLDGLMEVSEGDEHKTVEDDKEQ